MYAPDLGVPRRGGTAKLSAFRKEASFRHTPLRFSRRGKEFLARFSSLGKRTFSGGRSYILFVCTGNTCRSPIAYGVMRRMLADADITDLEIRTAGVMTVPGLMPTQECRQLLLKDGIDISNHRSCQLTHELIKRASLILGMTSFHVQMALRMAESARGKTFLIKEYTGGDSKNDQVQDPMGCTLEVYKKVYREIRAACRRLMRTEFVQSFVKGRKPLRKHPPAPAGEVRPPRKKAAGRAARARRVAWAKVPEKRAARPSRTGSPPATARARGKAARKAVRTAFGGTAHRRTPAIGGRVTSGKRAKRR